MNLKNVTLELSAKPFTDESEETMYSVCRQMFRQWKTLTDEADIVSVLHWISDGSEILEYTGDLNTKFEWAYWIGKANPHPMEKPSEEVSEREKRHTHFFPDRYTDGVGPRSYAWLKRLLEVIRETGTEITGKTIRIGTTFDLGPEFAVSKFKYEKHPEIMTRNNSPYPISLACHALLRADPNPYAAFPNGIPEGTSVGSFLGAQFKIFAKDIGYDYLWLSNGMGFGTETWGIKGLLFDKDRFYPEKADEATAGMLRFWKDFFDACPGCDIETRGSNYSAGLEMSTDAAPLKALYDRNLIAPPVNSPWAALNYMTGLEIAAWMSHVAELPGDRFPYRFYAHDPWFLNSPWLDRYGREPWDIYQPLSVCRLTSEGKAEVPNSISILTVDDTLGRMPDKVPREILPHLFEAMENAPDMAGPLVWVYPFDEYSDFISGKRRIPEAVFNEDYYIGEAVQAGFPLNTVISTGNFRKLMSHDPAKLRSSILVIPLAACTEGNLPSIRRALELGRSVMFYGSLKYACNEIREILGLECAEELTGKVTVNDSVPCDTFEHGKPSAALHVLPQFDGGGLTEIPAEKSTAEIFITAEQDGKSRVLASVRTLENGAKAGFVRSVLPCCPDYDKQNGSLEVFPAEQSFQGQRMMRHLLDLFGWSLAFRAFDLKTDLPRPNIFRHDNAFYFTAYVPDTDAEIVCTTPLGAPIPSEYETRVFENKSMWHPSKSWRKEVRVFVKQAAESVVRHKTGHCEMPEYNGRFYLEGLENAEVRIFLPVEGVKDVEVSGCLWWWDMLKSPLVDFEWEDTVFGRCILLKNVTGSLQVAWGDFCKQHC